MPGFPSPKAFARDVTGSIVNAGSQGRGERHNRTGVRGNGSGLACGGICRCLFSLFVPFLVRVNAESETVLCGPSPKMIGVHIGALDVRIVFSYSYALWCRVGSIC